MRSPVFRIRLSIACGAAVSLLSGCGTASGPAVTDQVVVAGERKEANTPAHSPRAVVSAPASAAASPSVREETASAGLPGVGPQTSASIPEEIEQVVLVTGNGINSPESTVVLYPHPANWRR
ncbi:hypothetical protein ACH4VM_05010 [Streptomyces sp. NPDC020792]|uniref:hypothetical protein n=1 Tax=Streptomyces sp. NPDC020792 TaxID=3365089 RepID=UPI0037B13221